MLGKPRPPGEVARRKARRRGALAKCRFLFTFGHLFPHAEKIGGGDRKLVHSHIDKALGQAQIRRQLAADADPAAGLVDGVGGLFDQTEKKMLFFS